MKRRGARLLGVRQIMRFRQLSALIVTLIVMALWSSQSAQARRVALVIGNSAYQHVAELKNPRNDARDIAKALKSIGFDDVDLKEDLDYRAMRMALRQFVQSSQGTELTFVFYAGHSIEVNKKNYLVPVDAKLANVVDVDFEAIQLDQVRTASSSASKLKMIILDACRNNPFKMAGRSSTRSVGRGLAIVEANTNELIAYSAKEGTTAQDGEESRNSPFTTALLKNLKKPGIEVGVMFRVIRDDVLSATSNQQEPYTYASLSGEPMFLNGQPTIVAPSTAPRPAYQAPPPISKETQEAAAAWAATKDTNSTAVLEAFRRRYPGTVYADMALAKSDELASQQRDKRQRDALERQRLRDAKQQQINSQNIQTGSIGRLQPPIEPSQPSCGPVPGGWRVVGVQSDDVLNVRAGPGNRFAIVAEIPPNGRSVSVLKCNGWGWCFVSYQCQTGWAYNRYIARENTPSPARQVSIGNYRVVGVASDDVLNMRRRPSVRSSIVYKLPHNASGISKGRCRRISRRATWCEIQYNGARGWVNARYIQ